MGARPLRERRKPGEWGKSKGFYTIKKSNTCVGNFLGKEVVMSVIQESVNKLQLRAILCLHQKTYPGLEILGKYFLQAKMYGLRAAAVDRWTFLVCAVPT